MKASLVNKVIVIPLHMPLGYPCDYIEQTAKILSKKNSVIFFNYNCPYPWKKLFIRKNLVALYDSFADISKFKKYTYFKAPSILPFSKFKVIIEINKKIGFWILSAFLWFMKSKVIIWQFYAVITKKIFNNQMFVYDCIDYINLTDETNSFFYKEKRLFRASDLVNFNSKALFKKKVEVNPILTKKSIITVCGCNNKLFNVEIKEIPKEFVNISQKKVVFIGVFNFRLDIELLRYIVNNNRGLKFILIGPIRKNVPKKFKEIIKEKNVLYLGEKEKNELPFYLNNCDLGIIPYDIKSDFVRYSNPMKAYEYLASGLPVVSTKILALEDYPKDIVYTTDNKEEFNQTIKRLINDWDEKKIAVAKNIAEKNSWENKIYLIEKFIIKNEKTN